MKSGGFCGLGDWQEVQNRTGAGPIGAWCLDSWAGESASPLLNQGVSTANEAISNQGKLLKPQGSAPEILVAAGRTNSLEKANRSVVLFTTGLAILVRIIRVRGVVTSLDT